MTVTEMRTARVRAVACGQFTPERAFENHAFERGFVPAADPRGGLAGYRRAIRATEIDTGDHATLVRVIERHHDYPDVDELGPNTPD